MKKRALRSLLAAAMAACMLVSMMPAAFSAEAKDSVTITLLETSDIHGMINPFDYASNKATSSSLAHIASIVAAERKKDPDLLLIDNGDTTQANYIQEFRNESVNPMIDALNYLDYDVWVLGNHEFNFEFSNLEKNIKTFDGSVLTGNIYKKDGSRWQNAYKIFDVKGVKVGVFGITAPHVPQWEASAPEHYDNMTFTSPMQETGKILDELEGKADIIIGSIHYGPDGEYGTEGCREIAKKYADRLDGLFIGHAHATIKEMVNGLPMMEPANNGQYVSKLALSLTKQNGKWTVKSDATVAELLKSADATPDAAVLARYAELDKKTLALASKKVGEVGKTFMDPVFVLPGIPAAVIQDNPIIDLVNKVQTEKSGADVSMAALFDSDANLVKGPFLNRDSVKIYTYDNTLFAVKVTGKQLKAIMERQAGNFFNTYKPGDVSISFNENIRLYNYDMFSGVNYEIDISKPEGKRIVNVMYKGAPLTDDVTLTLAMNNYRYGGLSSAGLINASDVVYEGGAVREMIGDYVASLTGSLMPATDNNWKIVGAELNDPQKDLIYEKVNKGELKVPASKDGRTPNVAALNGPQLRAAGVLPALPGQPQKPAEPQKPAGPETPASGTYTVVKGDTLWRIAQKTLGSGSKWNAIYQINKATVKEPGKIYVGQVLRLPAA
jgi:2',3'-cyclic-nucleotide 2'-phosphodiesterase/3'-nucleotidase